MMLDEGLPSGWISLPLGELGEYVRGVTYQKPDAKGSGTDSSIPVLRANNLGETDFILDDLVHLDRTLVDDTQVIRKHDVVFAMSSGSLRHVGKSVMAARDMDAAFGAFCGLVRLHNGVSPAFVALQFKTPAFRKHVESAAAGTNINNLKSSVLLSYPTVVAPLREQRRVVAKIEELFSELDASAESLTRARALLTTYRHALLKAAFEGKLTADWRAKNADKLAKPGDLLRAIRSARERRFSDALAKWTEAIATWDKTGRNGPKPDKPTLRAWPTRTEYPDLPPLPIGWTYVPFDCIAYTIRNGVSQKPDGAGSLRIFRISAVRPMQFDLSDFRLIGDQAEFSSFKLLRDDLVFTRYNGSTNFVGVAALYRGDGSHIYPDKLIRCDIAISGIDPGYIEKAVNCAESRTHIEQRIRTTAGQAGISGADLKGMPVPICNLEEQMEVNNILDAKLSLVNQMEADIENALVKLTGLRQSILKRAFSGRLIPQDPSDEPAGIQFALLGAEEAPARRTARRKLSA